MNAVPLKALLFAGACSPCPPRPRPGRSIPSPKTASPCSCRAPPVAAPGTFKTAAGLTVPSTTYALRQDDIVYSMTVADFSQTPVEQQAAIAEAVKAYGAAGEIKLDVSERIDRQFGRQLSLAAGSTFWPVPVLPADV